MSGSAPSPVAAGRPVFCAHRGSVEAYQGSRIAAWLVLAINSAPSPAPPRAWPAGLQAAGGGTGARRSQGRGWRPGHGQWRGDWRHAAHLTQGACAACGAAAVLHGCRCICLVTAASLSRGRRAGGLRGREPSGSLAAWELISTTLKRSGVAFLSPEQAAAALRKGTPVVDIRPSNEFGKGRLPGAANCQFYQPIQGGWGGVGWGERGQLPAAVVLPASLQRASAPSLRQRPPRCAPSPSPQTPPAQSC